MMPSIKNAFVSVSDKTNLVPFAKKLHKIGVRMYSTGGTHTFLRRHKIPVTELSQITEMPEILDGRVKTLHPSVHAGILAKRDTGSHMKTVQKYGYPLWDLVVVNLYPFEKVIRQKQVSLEQVIEHIDIGGVALLRAAAKNHASVTVVSCPEDYDIVIKALQSRKKVSLQIKKQLAIKAFEKTSAYDALIETELKCRYLSEDTGLIRYTGGHVLRYGENPHQKATVYHMDSGKDMYRCLLNSLQGKAMSYNNLLDSVAAIRVLEEFGIEQPCVVVVKHGIPCGVAISKTTARAMRFAWEGDITSSFGSVIGTCSVMDAQSALFLKDKFFEVLVAPRYTKAALVHLKKKKNLRLIEVPGLMKKDGLISKATPIERRLIHGGLVLEQERDDSVYDKFDCVTKRLFRRQDKPLYVFSYRVVKHLKSNAICICHRSKEEDFMVLGMGSGQPNRVDALRRLALPKAKETGIRLYGDKKIQEVMQACVLASDAFFPFEDSVMETYDGGIRKIIQPGGSIRDDAVINACNNLGLVMIFTSQRHFLH